MEIKVVDVGLLGIIGLKLMPIAHKVYAMLSVVTSSVSALRELSEDLLASSKCAVLKCSLDSSGGNNIVLFDVSYTKTQKQ